MIEQWRDVIGYEGYYQISDAGRVKRIKRGRHTRPGYILKPRDNKGYLRLGLCRNGQKRHFSVHRLVALAFIGPCPPGYQVNHRNGTKTDNRANNLEWVTCTENNRDAMTRTGCRIGEKNGRAKLTAKQVKDIKSLFATKQHTKQGLGRQFGVSETAIRFIIIGRNWKHII